MLKNLFIILFAFFSLQLGFASEQDLESTLTKENVLNEIEKAKEKKESLNKVFAELSEEQRLALEEEFKEQFAEIAKDLKTLESQLTESQTPQE
jgi:hypothetical protein